MLGLIAIAAALASAACGGSDETASTSPFPTVVESTPRGCAYLSGAVVEDVSDATVQRQDLAPGPEVVCSTAFVGASGDFVAGVSELRGGLETLQGLRKAKIEEFGIGALEPQPVLGTGAFVVRKRYLAFRHSERVIVLETGYGSEGELLLTVSELRRLARLVSGRL